MKNSASDNALADAFELNYFGSESLGKAIRSLRRFRGMTQEDLAMKSGVSTKFISNMENGKPTARLDKVLLILRVLDAGTRLYDLRSGGAK